MCGIFGIYDHPEAANLTYLGLYALQHRGQESTGIVSSDGRRLHHYRQMGHVSETFSREILKTLSGKNAIGHVRYSTAGSSEIKNAQPFVVDYAKGGIAIADNGNLTNAFFIRSELESAGSIFQSNMDTEVIVHLIARSERKDVLRSNDPGPEAGGGRLLLALFDGTGDDRGSRSPWVQTLVLGQLKDSPVIASETCALDLINARFVREIEPGEIVVFREGRVESRQTLPSHATRLLHFESILLALTVSSSIVTFMRSGMLWESSWRRRHRPMRRSSFLSRTQGFPLPLAMLSSPRFLSNWG